MAEGGSILADVLESIIGAIYLESGLNDAQKFIHTHWADWVVKALKDPPIDSKTALQEWSQAQGLGLPKYQLVGKEGPEHKPTLYISAEVKSIGRVVVPGSNRKKAEQSAATQLLEQAKAKMALKNKSE